MPVSIKGTGGGSVTLDAGAAAAATTLTLPNTTGTVALTAGPTFTGTVTATTITSPSATALTIQSAGTTAMTVNTSQNVGIGTTSPGYKLDISTASASDGLGINLTNSGSTGAGINFLQSGVDSFFVSMPAGTGGLKFVASGTNERMRIDSSGNLLVGTTSYAAGQNSIKLNGSSSNFSRSSTAASAQIYFENPNGTVGQIQTSGSATSYLTSSDYRLKEDVESLTSGLSTVSAMRPVSYKWKVDGSVGNGFIAHELQAIVPDAVSGEKDAVNEDGSIKPQGVDYSKIVVHLVAAIQELSAKNDSLEAANAAFEARLAALSAQIAAFTPAQ